MKVLLWFHIGAGLIALVAGAIAAAVRKGGSWHAAAGNWFFGSMLALGVTASILSPFKTPPESPIGGVIVCYFVATSWLAARRRNLSASHFEKLAGVLILVIAFLMIEAAAQSIPAAVTKFERIKANMSAFLGGVCLLAGLGDLRFALRGPLTSRQRISRHLWRMCYAFFIATGSFFLGQQQFLPQTLRGSALLPLLAFAPLILLLFWLVRIRLPRSIPSTALPSPEPNQPKFGQFRPNLEIW